MVQEETHSWLLETQDNDIQCTLNIYLLLPIMCSNPKVFFKEAILRNFLKFTRYHMHQNRKKYAKI